ncbi:hypothetical protein [Tritonibacter mobilis]|uniref:hypothetical protein n=1 Tax=Tritonibacter mobilis TaxID=379347 RepID=UPI000806DBD9|nr:hypothetical protein [Tritonibacter mobilis]
MSLVFPLAISEFAGMFKVGDMDISLSESRESAETTGGDLLFADNGPRLWRGYYVPSRIVHRDYHDLKGRIEALQIGNRAFLAYDHVTPGLKHDPDGEISATLSAKLGQVENDGQSLRIKGLPQGFKLAFGDRFSFTTQAGAIAYHRVISAGVEADATGSTPLFTVSPHILPGAAVNDPVVLFRPYFKARIVPQSVRPGKAKELRVEGMRFEFVQQVKP